MAKGGARVAARLPSLASISKDLAQVPLARRIATILFIAAAALLARFSWDLDAGGRCRARAVRRPRHLCTALDHPADQDRRIVLIPFTPDTQRSTGERSPLDRTTLANALTNIDAMGAKSIGIDILIDQAQPDDPLLIDALHRMKTPVWVGYATNSRNSFDVEVWQQEFMDAFIKAVDNPNVRKSSIRLEADPDGVMRNWPTQYRDLPPFLPVAMHGGNRASNYRGSVAYRVPKGFGTNDQRDVFNSLPIDLFAMPEGAAMLAGEVKGRYVLVGGDLPDIDQFDTPATRINGEPTTGLKIHATLLAQILDGRMPGKIANPALWVIAVFVVLAGAFTSMVEVRPWVLTLQIIGQLMFFSAVPFFFEWQGVDTQGLPAFGWIAGWLLAYMATEATVKAMGSDQKKFAQSALGKYLPPDIAEMILKDPSKLSLSGERLPIFTLFTDIQGFTSLSHVMEAEKTASILNAYLDGMSDIVLRNGGTIDKFVGDAVVAFWGAPIAREDDGDRAIAAVLQMLEFTQGFGASDPDRAMLGRNSHRPPPWRGDRRQFRRRRTDQLHRARRCDEYRRPARGGQQISQERGVSQRRGAGAIQRPGCFPADGADHPVGPRHPDRGVGTLVGHRSGAACRIDTLMAPVRGGRQRSAACT